MYDDDSSTTLEHASWDKTAASAAASNQQFSSTSPPISLNTLTQHCNLTIHTTNGLFLTAYTIFFKTVQQYYAADGFEFFES